MLKCHMPEDLLINSRHADLPVGKVCTVCHIPKTFRTGLRFYCVNMACSEKPNDVAEYYIEI